MTPLSPELQPHHQMKFSVISRTPFFVRGIFRGYTQHILSPADRAVSEICVIHVAVVFMQCWFCWCGHYCHLFWHSEMKLLSGSRFFFTVLMWQVSRWYFRNPVGLKTSQINFINQRKKKPIWILEEMSNALQIRNGIMDFWNEA